MDLYAAVNTTLAQALEGKVMFGFYFRTLTKFQAKPGFVGLLGAIAKILSQSVAFM